MKTSTSTPISRECCTCTKVVLQVSPMSQARTAGFASYSPTQREESKYALIKGKYNNKTTQYQHQHQYQYKTIPHKDYNYMKFYSVPFAAMAVLFHGSAYVYGSKLRTDTMTDADADAYADHRRLLTKSDKQCLDRCSERFGKCKKECPSTTPTTRIHSNGYFPISWKSKGSKTVGSACHSGCKRRVHRVSSGNKSLLACGEPDTNKVRWVGTDETNCRIKIPYQKYNNAGTARCVWEIKETCW